MNDTEKQEVELKLAELEQEYKKETFEAGSDTFVYCFDEMSMDRILEGYRLFKIDLEMVKQLPKLPSEVQILVERKTLQHAFAAILMKQTAHGYEKYDTGNLSSMDALKSLTGKDYKKLESCKQDFFLNSGLSSEVLTMQSEKQTKDAVNLLKEITPEQLERLTPLIQNAMNGQLLMPSDVSSTMTESITSE